MSHEVIDDNFKRKVQQADFPQLLSSTSRDSITLSDQDILQIFDSQLLSRQFDLCSRILKKDNKVFYTIGSSGHEGMAAVAAALRIDDMAFLHYRDAAFMIQRSKEVSDINIIKDLLLSFMAAEADPIASGRHKVLGSLALNIPPQTSTIASHLPKAVGAAASIKRAQTLQIPHTLADDSLVVCSFGDASVNHSTALGAFNTAQWIAQKQYPLPLIFVCEDNGLGISVPTPTDWVEQRYSNQPWLHYIQVDGLNLFDVYRATLEAEHIARVEKKPVFLHIKCVRLLGHAGSDFELHYRTQPQIDADQANDPLLHSANLIIQAGLLSAAEIIDRYENAAQQILKTAEQLNDVTHLDSAQAVMASVIPPKKSIEMPAIPDQQQRQKVFADKFEKVSEPLNMSQQLNYALHDLMLQYDNIIVFGEDVAKKGGVYRVTADLQNAFGQTRVFDTLLDEQTILGQAIGHAHNGFLPIPEIQFLAYLHNAEDQLRGEAATLSFFSNGQFTNPMVLRIASFGYQKGFGGHFHNDNSIAVLRDLPGIIVACPSNGVDAAKMLRRCVQLAHQEQRVVVFLEPIALYMQKDLHAKGDNLWASAYSDPNEMMDYAEIGVDGDSNELAIISYANGYYLSQQAKKIIQQQHGIDVKLIDLRWLAPLSEEAILNAVSDCKRVLIVDEGRRSGSISEQLVTLLTLQLQHQPKITVLTGEDSFIPLGTSWQYVLPSVESICAAITRLIDK